MLTILLLGENSLYSKFGIHLRRDVVTFKMEKTNFARVCVMVDLSKTFRSGNFIKGYGGVFFQTFMHEGIYSICFMCGVVGYSIENCSSGVEERHKPRENVKLSSIQQSKASYEVRDKLNQPSKLPHGYHSLNLEKGTYSYHGKMKVNSNKNKNQANTTNSFSLLEDMFEEWNPSKEDLKLE